MLGIPILDVAIGLMFVYLILSLAVTAANEMFAAWFKRRAWMLHRGLVNLLEGDQAQVSKLLDHALVRSLYEPRGVLTRVMPVLSKLFGNGPSYIPSRTFALALLDTVAPLTDGKRSLPATGPLADVLRVLSQEANGDEEKLKERVEVWFNDSMERVSGWYKRHTQAVSLVFAAIITVGTNADTLVIGKALWSDPQLRQAVVERAEQYVRENQAPVAPGTDEVVPPPPLPPDQQAEVEFDAAEANFKAAMQDLEELQLPIGWEDPEPVDTALVSARLVVDDARDDWPGPLWQRGAWARWRTAFDQHTLGWLITIMAISLGAPFWFDILNKVVSIRSAGKAPEETPKAPKEVPKPRQPGQDT